MRRRRGIIRGNFSKLGLLCVALIIGMGSLTLGYPAWTDTLSISGTVTTGSWEQCGTAYAYAGGYATCFTELIENGPWGWSNGPLPPDAYLFDIYAGAGQCNLANGTLVGTLTVFYNGDTVTVTYDMYEGYAMKETHLYVGTEPLPKNNGDYTTAPGQYPYSNVPADPSVDSYTVENLSENIYVVAHAVVCWFEISPP